LLTVVRPHLERLARRYADPARPSESVSDLVQESWVRAWRKLDRFRGAADDEQTRAAFLAWTGRLLDRLGRNRRRDGRRRCRCPEQPVVSLGGAAPAGSTDTGRAAEPAARQPTPSANVRDGEKARLVLEALADLPDAKDRAIVRLCFFEGWSLRQIAEQMQFSYDAVRQRFHSSLRRLERSLEELR